MLRQLALVVVSGRLVSGAFPLTTPLNQVPFIMTHDTAMGYLGEDHLYENSQTPEDLVIAWSKTQIGTVTEQLNCGARAFDMRPHVSENDGLVMHHGGVIVYHLFKDMMQEMMVWAAEHPDELVIAEVVHCGGDTEELEELCDEQSRDVLDELGIPHIYKDFCPDALQGVTLGQAKEVGALEGGGTVLAIWGECWESNYDNSRNCRGYEYESAGVSRKYSCWVNGTNPDHAVGRIFEYLDETHAKGPPANGMLWQMQALWQVSEAAVILGMDEGSSILTDIRYSRLNRFLFENLTVGRWGVQGVNGVNMLEVDHVCDQGSNILIALDPDMDIVYTAIPDDIIINHTGVSDSILAGDSILFPEVPEDFVPKTFTDGKAIERHHRSARWGNTNDIVDFIKSGDEDKEEEYLMGILGTSILLMCLFVLWGTVIFLLKCTKKNPWLRGEIPKIPEEPTGKSADGDSVEQAAGDVEPTKPNYRAVKIRKTLKRIRITVLVCGFLILLFSGLLIGIGFQDIKDALDAAEEGLPQLRGLFESGLKATDFMLIQAHQTQEARIDFINVLVDNCNLTGEVVENNTGVGIDDPIQGDSTDVLIALNETLNNNTFLVDGFTKMNNSLASLIDDIESVEDTVDALDESVLFPIATSFVLVFDVVVMAFMLCVYYAWKKQLPKSFNCFNSAFAIWVFLLMLFAAYLVSMLALVAATLAADFCIDTPDNQIVRLIDASAPFDEYLEYYVRGCDPEIKPELMFDLFKLFEAIIIRINDLLTDLSNLDPETVPCNNTDLVFDALGTLQEEYNTYVNVLYLLAQAYDCTSINPVYAALAYSTGCVNGFDSLSYIFGFMLVISVLSMTMITLRVAWYTHGEVPEEAGLPEGEDEQPALEEEDEAQDEGAELEDDEIDVDAASVDEEVDGVDEVLASSGGEAEGEEIAAGVDAKEQ